MITPPRLLKSAFIMLTLLPHLAFGTMPSLNDLIRMKCTINGKNKTIEFEPGDIKYTDGNQPYFIHNEITYYLTQSSTGDNTYRVSGIEGGWLLQVLQGPESNLMQEPAIAITPNTSTFIMPDTRIPPPEFTYQPAYPQEGMDFGLSMARYKKETGQLNQQLEELSVIRNEEVDQLNQQLQELSVIRKEEVQQLNQKLEQEITKSKEEAEKLRKEISRLNKNIKDKISESMQSENKHKSENDRLEQKNRELLEDNGKLQYRLKSYSEEHAKSLETIRTLENKIHKLQKEKETADKKNNELQRKTENQKDEINKLTAQHKKTKQAEARVTECESEIAEKNRLIALLKDKLIKLNQEKKQDTQRAKEASEKIANQQRIIHGLQKWIPFLPQQQTQKKQKVEPATPPITAEQRSPAQEAVESLVPYIQQQWKEAQKQIEEQSRQLEEQGRQMHQLKAALDRKEDQAVSRAFDPLGRLEALGVVAEHTPGDGACLLHAVTQGLEETPDTAAFNQLLVEYILGHGQNWQDFIQQAISLAGASSQELLNQLLNLQAPSADNPEHWGDHRLFA